MAINIQDYNFKPNNSGQTTTISTKKVEPKTSNGLWALMNKDIELGNSFGLKRKEALYSELEILLSAGLDIQSSLNLIKETQKKQSTKAIIQQIKDDIISGSTLSEALEQTQKFSDYEIFSIRIGEETGQLTTVLKELAAFFVKSLQYRRQLIGALSYPVFVILFALGVVFFLLNYLVPMFSSVYERFDQKLPTITEYIIFLSDWVANYSIYTFLGFFIIILSLYTQRTKLWFRRSSSWSLLRLPIFGKVVKKIYLARYCQAMALLLSSKVPLLKAVRLVKKMINFYPIEQSLIIAEADILKGNMLNQTLKQFSFYPLQLIALVKVGEEASQLDTMFEKLAQQYNQEVDQQTAIIGSLLEPILIISLGILVGFVLIAMYMPLFQLSMGIQ